MLKKPEITIIGPGVVGSAIAQLACKAGYCVTAIAGGTPQSREKLAQQVSATAHDELAPAANAGQLVILTVDDDAIASVCKQLADDDGLKHNPIVAHCCGAADSDILSPARQAGCKVGSIHPLQTFPDVASAMAQLAGAYCFIEGDPLAVDALEKLAEAMGAKAVRIDPAVKPLYHAAAVMGANYLTTMLSAAVEMLRQTGLSESQAAEALGPLARATVENTLSKGAPAALTGPVARGDIETVRSHLAAMQEKTPALLNLYRQAALRTVDIAQAKGSASGASLQAITELLTNF